MLAHQLLEALQVLLLQQLHQLVVLPVGRLAAGLLGDGQGGKPGDVIILPSMTCRMRFSLRCASAGGSPGPRWTASQYPPPPPAGPSGPASPARRRCPGVALRTRLAASVSPGRCDGVNLLYIGDGKPHHHAPARHIPTRPSCPACAAPPVGGVRLMCIKSAYSVSTIRTPAGISPVMMACFKVRRRSPEWACFPQKAKPAVGHCLIPFVLGLFFCILSRKSRIVKEIPLWGALVFLHHDPLGRRPQQGGHGGFRPSHQYSRASSSMIFSF